MIVILHARRIEASPVMLRRLLFEFRPLSGHSANKLGDEAGEFGQELIESRSHQRTLAATKTPWTITTSTIDADFAAW